MVQGTSSHVGKSILTAAFCRILSQMGLKVAPFKAQNMALNSHVTADGGEIGRAQALQAEAAGIEPSVDMNPVLLKPLGDARSQVIVHGRVFGVMTAAEYHVFKKEAASYVMESYSRLAAANDVVVIEGAGSPAEINLRDNDIANMGVAEMVDSPVVVVGDIDRGGVFASFVGTLELLSEPERQRVRGFIVNKFRGDIELLRPGLDFLTRKTGRPVLAVVPYLTGLILPDEDGVSLDDARWSGPNSVDAKAEVGIRIAVVRLPRIANFTDFDPFRYEPGVTVDFIRDPSGLEGAEMAVIPGSKNTIEDMLWLRQRGFDKALERFVSSGAMVAGICGGFQMMGTVIKDPDGVESDLGSTPGLALVEMETVHGKEKNNYQVLARPTVANDLVVKGYEIHMGQGTTVRPFARIIKRNSVDVEVDDGYLSEDGNVWGTYIHGIFDNDTFRAALLERLRCKHGSLQSKGPGVVYEEKKEQAIVALADVVRESMDMAALLDIIGLDRGGD